MLGRFLGLAAIIAAVSVGIAGIASRSSSHDAGQTSATVSGNHDNWTTHKLRKDQSLAAAATASARGDSGGPREVLLGRSSDSHFYADADIDGANIRVLVDSGASIVALTRRDAEAIGLDVDRLPISGTARTAGGDVPMRTVMLDSVEIEGIEVRGVQAAVIDADMGVSLLGQSFLSKLSAVNVEGDTMTLR